MQASFDLIITADTPTLTAEFVLRDAHGQQLAVRQTDFKPFAASDLRGLSDLRDYLRHYVLPGQERAAVAQLGVCIAEQVLGEEIFRHLYASEAQRTLRIQLPGATEAENVLAAALARVPWELARPSANQATLGERNLLLRVVHEMDEPATAPLELAPQEALRVLFVFAEARGSRPLAVRKERRALRHLFEKEIYPQRRVVAHFLTHGVTRERLQEQIRENGGYHLVHWSGHGHLNLLELAEAGGRKSYLSGAALRDLFKEAGGFLPRLFFLSACHSGDILRVKDWQSFAAVAAGKDPESSSPARQSQLETKEITFEEQPGYTGTAHALLQGGVPTVVAMRYAVGDDYARELSLAFYRALLAYAQPQNAAAALTTARQELRQRHNSRYDVGDHATPVLYGASAAGLQPPAGRSPALDTRPRRLRPSAELTEAQHEHFVGRTWELAELLEQFIGASRYATTKPVALITGLGGMGKTALTAEALALWETRFEWVLLFQAKPQPLSFDNFLREVDLRLRGELGRYHEHVTARPADAIYRDASESFNGAARYERLTSNLIRALSDEPLWLVLDNFETNLKAAPQSPGSEGAPPLWECQEAEWEQCLARLAEELRDAPSRVWLTCRYPLAALAADGCHCVQLGPLPPGEAALYLGDHAALSRMFFSEDGAEKALALRVLAASRFHPLLLDRLARLAAGGDALRPQLLEALTTLETRSNSAQLPALFATRPGDAKEIAYLNDALTTSLDQLIQDASPAARRLLWMIALANEPIERPLLESVWSGEETEEMQQLRQIKQMLKNLPALPPEMQEQFKEMPPELRAILDNLPPPTAQRQPPTPLLRHLLAVGLVMEAENGALSCHELVRERICARMAAQPHERADLTENGIWLGFADRLIAAFRAVEGKNTTAALAVGSRALVYCVQAEAYDRLGQFASSVVTSSMDPRLLDALIPHLRAAADSAPAGESRWRCLCFLADALWKSGRPDASLPFYEQAAVQARQAAAIAAPHSPAARQAWAEVGWITGNWANALRNVGKLDAAHQRQLESAEAEKNAGRPAVYIIGSELEALRIEIMRGQVAEALPEVETRLRRIESWWRQFCAGQPVPEAPDPEFLARAYVSALDIAKEAYFAQKDWEAALPRLDAMLEVQRALQRPAEDLAAIRFNRANVLKNLGRFSAAQAELEACLQVFQHDPANSAKVFSSLADLFDEQGDVTQAIRQQRRALALCEQLPDPHDRALSHNNLAIYLGRQGSPAALAEAPHHELAALLYRLVTGLGQDLQTSLHNYGIRFRRANAAGTTYAAPRLAALLADPAFRPLDEWLAAQRVNVDDLQAEVDDLLEQVRQAAIS